MTFLKVRETLQELKASRKDKTLFQSCHILHKQAKIFYYTLQRTICFRCKEINIS